MIVHCTSQATLDAAVAAGDTPRVSAGAYRVSGSATVEAWGSATVRASGSATVEASGSATVLASGLATVRATDYVAVHAHSPHANITGGVVTHKPDIAVVDIWLAYHGAEVTDGIAVLYKAVDDGWTTDRGMDYTPGATPIAADWDPMPRECG